jgi:hypothetical protein
MTGADRGHEGQPSPDESPPRGLRGNPIDADAVPAPLRRAMARVQADFEAATGLDCAFWFEEEPETEPDSDSDSDDDLQSLMCMIAAGGSAWGFSVDVDSDEEEAAVRMADEGNEQVFEALGESDSWEAAARWPPCPWPGHDDHPVAPDLRGGRAVWVCHGEVVAEIGRLGECYGSRSS